MKPIKNGWEKLEKNIEKLNKKRKANHIIDLLKIFKSKSILIKEWVR